MGILKDIDRIIVEADIDDEEVTSPSVRDIESRDRNIDIDDEEMEDEIDIRDDEEDEKPEVLGDVMKHLENLKKIVYFIDGLTTDQGSTTAFEAEIAIRKAIEKMKTLGDELYKKNKKR
jgi:hypothetical protein